MRVVIAGFGSLGDTRPFVALAAGLRARGHDTVVCLDRCGEATARRVDVPFRALSGDFRARVEAGWRSTETGQAGAPVGLRLFHELSEEFTQAWVDEIADTARDHRADVVIGSSMAVFASLTAAEAVGARPALGSAFPLTKTAAFPSPLFPPTVPAQLNRLTHQVAATAMWAAFWRATERDRRRRGLPRLRKPWGTMPALYGHSPHLVPRPPDWPSDARVCGEWHLPEPDYAPPAALRAFLDAGAPPVYVGFGSMAEPVTARLTHTIIAALRGRRVVLNPGWAGGAAGDLGDLPDSVHVVDDVPHGWLLPRCSMAFHHAGAGTTHAAARAGIPSVPVPFTMDQPFWAARLADAGIGTAPLDRHRATAGDVQERVHRADSESMRRRAARVASAMAAEDPVAPVIDHLGHWHR